jgi:hypothetical protein
VVAGVGDDPARDEDNPATHRDAAGVEEVRAHVQQGVDVVEARRVKAVNLIGDRCSEWEIRRHKYSSRGRKQSKNIGDNDLGSIVINTWNRYIQHSDFKTIGKMTERYRLKRARGTGQSNGKYISERLKDSEKNCVKAMFQNKVSNPREKEVEIYVYLLKIETRGIYAR